MLVFVKALATALVLGLIGLIVGPIAGLILIPSPAEVCGMWWVIPAGTGGVIGGVVGAAIGFAVGLIV